MSAIVRVKRFLDEDPLETFILQCKKRKIDENKSTDEDLSTTVLKFAGTIQENENIITHLKDKKLADLKTNYKKHEVNLTDKLRLERREASKSNRYKIVNCFRANEKSEVTILDVETDINQNDANVSNKNSELVNKYVYDLYYTSNDLGDTRIEDYVSIYPLDDPLVDEIESDTEDSDDSNAENNWRNDYPDEEDLESINEDDMIEAMKNVDLDDLSSDSKDGDLYENDSDEEYEDALDENDVTNYGKRYAAFKAKHTKFVETSSFKNDYYGDLDEEEYYY